LGRQLGYGALRTNEPRRTTGIRQERSPESEVPRKERLSHGQVLGLFPHPHPMVVQIANTQDKRVGVAVECVPISTLNARFLRYASQVGSRLSESRLHYGHARVIDTGR
jgi:hypothetical protein